MAKYVICQHWHMTYFSKNIWWYGCLENRQDISNAAIGFKVIQKTFSCNKKWKNLGIPFPPLTFLKSFVKVICLVADHFSSYIKNKSSSLIYTYSSMRKLKIKFLYFWLTLMHYIGYMNTFSFINKPKQLQQW